MKASARPQQVRNNESGLGDYVFVTNRFEGWRGGSACSHANRIKTRAIRVVHTLALVLCPIHPAWRALCTTRGMLSLDLTTPTIETPHHRTMSMAQACERLGVSCRTLQDWMGRGKVTYAQMASDVQLFVDSLSNELDRQSSAPRRPMW